MLFLRPHMRRASLVYIFMFLVLIVGLWVILARGAKLQAPADFAGRWELIPIDDSDATPQSMYVDQSGRYFELRFGDETHYSLQLVDEQRIIQQDRPHIRIELAGRETRARFDGAYDGEVFDFTLESGGVTRAWTALWVERRYLRPQPTEPFAATADAF
jgi:hypothetical protein